MQPLSSRDRGRGCARATFAVFSAILALASGSLTATAQQNIRSGHGSVVLTDTLHPNGLVFDQVLMTGPAVTVAADPAQVVRVSFLDPDDDIVQVEFSGTGTISIELDPATYSPAAAPKKYHQPGILYVQGRATVRVRDAGPDTFVAIFSVGRGNAVNQALFPVGMTYDARADVARLDVAGGTMGAILTGNVRYGGDRGVVGITAPDTSVRYRVVVGEIRAQSLAIPALRLGSGSGLEWDAGEILVAGGSLQSANGSPFDASSGTGSPFPRIRAVAGALSSGDGLAAGRIEAAFASRLPGEVSVNGIPRSTRGYLPASFNELLSEAGFDALDFGPGAAIEFSGGNSGTYAVQVDTLIENERVQGHIEGAYSYEAGGAHHSRMSFSLTFDRVTLASASLSYKGTVQDLAQRSGTPLPVRISVVADFMSYTNGTATASLLYSNGAQENQAVVFDEDTPLDFSFL